MYSTSKLLAGCCVALAVTAFAPALALAESNAPKLIAENTNFEIGKGDMLVKFSLNPKLTRGDGADIDAVTFEAGTNYFLTDSFAPGIQVFAQSNDIQGGGTSSLGGMLVDARWYFHPDNKRLLPYGEIGLGFGAGKVAGGKTEGAFAFKLGTGLDFLLTPNVAFGTAFRWNLFAGNVTFHQIEILPINFTVYFGGDFDALDKLFQ